MVHSGYRVSNWTPDQRRVADRRDETAYLAAREQAISSRRWCTTHEPRPRQTDDEREERRKKEETNTGNLI